MKIDDLLFDKVFQPFSNWFQRLTGKNCFFLAYACMVLNVSLNLLGHILEKNYRFSLDLFIAFSFFPLIATLEWKYSRHTGPARFLNFARADDFSRSTRFLWLLISMVMGAISLPLLPSHLSVIYYSLAIIVATASLYFAACTPLPPGESKAQKWAKALAQGLKQLVPRPSISPAPA